jgi:hypothetical protein
MLIGPYSILAYTLRNIYTLQYNCEKMKMKNLYIWHMVLVWKNDIVGACMKFNIHVRVNRLLPSAIWGTFDLPLEKKTWRFPS